ncbi:hypothetical protein [Marinobacter sp. bablab_jr008]|jgi:hypothetical protein|uniref:hypothetical protein n=1 Tax=Marinobacter sp. bablab_jr008 TaxID=2755064 RepID=UPI001D188F74|nr:hypothetical protein [Marinobacter sp. bablab_jr008]
MSMQTVTRQEFEEGLREDEARTAVRASYGGLIETTQEKEMTALIGTSADDCAISITSHAETEPVETIRKVIRVLELMNSRGIEKKSHRQAMLRAGRKALNKIGEFQQ